MSSSEIKQLDNAQGAGPDRAPGGQKGNKSAAKSGHYALRSSLKRDGLSVLTRRQREAVAECRKQIVDDLGGDENVPELKRLQIERYLITELLLQSLDGWLLQQPTLINRRRRALYPIVVQRNELVQTSLKLAQAIGLERRRKAVDIVGALAGMAHESEGGQ